MPYRKKPIVIEAFQWNGQPPRAWPKWAKDHLGLRYENTNIQVDTHQGTVRANKGDWIILQIDGEVYPCTDELFQKSYEVVSDESVQQAGTAAAGEARDDRGDQTSNW